MPCLGRPVPAVLSTCDHGRTLCIPAGIAWQVSLNLRGGQALIECYALRIPAGSSAPENFKETEFMLPEAALNTEPLSSESSPKRVAIVRAAGKLFLESGYGETSMDAIAAEAEVSKRTVYSYFSGKDALFEAVMIDLCESEAGMPHSDLPDHPAEEVLTNFGRGYVKVVSSDIVLTIFRIAASESARFPELGETFYRCGPMRSNHRLAAYLKARERAGELQVPEPELAAAQFLALVKSEFFLRLMLGVGPKPDEADVERLVGSAVRTFLSRYGRKAG